MAAEAGIMIEMNNLSFGYAKNNNLFKNIELDLKKGGICGLLGKNGAGKTTLLNMIAGLVFPKSGDCRVMGQVPKQRHPNFLSDLYFLSEDLFVPALTIEKYVTFYAPFYPRFDQKLFQNCLKEFALPQQALLTKLSYGQKKKFLISFGLAANCRLFILDEPTNGLDIPSKAQFRKLLASSISDEKLFIISTHQVHDVENLVDSIVLIDEGKIIFQHNLIEVAEALAFIQQSTHPEVG